MRFRVAIGLAAFLDAEAIFDFIRADSPVEAGRWLDGLLAAIDSLGHFPRRFPRAPQARPTRREVRQMLYKSHRVFFTVVGKEVRTLHIRHGARLPRREP